MKTRLFISVLVTLIFFSGCGNYLHKLATEMKNIRQQEALAGTEDTTMVNAFIKELPESSVSKNQIFTDEKLDLGKQTTNINDWTYRPVEFFERNADKETLAYKTWMSTVATRGGIIKKYNAKAATKISNYIYLNKLHRYERYFYSLTPIYIEYDNNNNMISAFMKVLKTEDLSSVGGLVVQGRRPYYAYEYNIIVLKTNMRKLQMNTSKQFFEDNILDSNVVVKHHEKQVSAENTSLQEEVLSKNNRMSNVNINQIIIDKFNTQNNTNLRSMQEIQAYLAKQ